MGTASEADCSPWPMPLHTSVNQHSTLRDGSARLALQVLLLEGEQRPGPGQNLLCQWDAEGPQHGPGLLCFPGLPTASPLPISPPPPPRILSARGDTLGVSLKPCREAAHTPMHDFSVQPQTPGQTGHHSLTLGQPSCTPPCTACWAPGTSCPCSSTCKVQVAKFSAVQRNSR